MPQLHIKSLLWRKVNQATIDTLKGTSGGQYDIRLNTSAHYLTFFSSLPKINPNANGGFEFTLPLQPITGAAPVASSTVSIKYMGPNSARKDWIISSQRPTTAYEAWKLNIAVPSIPDATIPAGQHYVLILKDENNNFHGRWLTDVDFSTLDQHLQAILKSADHGVVALPTPGSDAAKEVLKQVKKNHNVLLYGPPGTGKSHLLQEVIALFGTQYFVLLDTDKQHDAIHTQSQNDHKALHNWVTFHQSYSYEEFVISLKPNTASTKLLSLEPVAGTLLELSEFARIKGNASLLVIDEINRGNVSRIFGEFITLLEADKRLDKENNAHFGTIGIKLPYINSTTKLSVQVPGHGAAQVPNPYTLPYHVYLIATMNSVDRSTTPIDAALRRRFHIINIKPDLQQLASAMKITMPNLATSPSFTLPLATADQVKELSIYLLDYLNLRLSQFLGQDYQFGQWYLKSLMADFGTVDEAIEVLVGIWNNQLYPQLQEYFNGRTEQLINILKLKIEGPEKTPIVLDMPSESLEEIGAGPILRTQLVEGKDTMAYLEFLVSAHS